MINNKRIYQIYCGRWEEANILDHEGEVLKRMVDFDWIGLKKRLDLTHIYLLALWDVGQRIEITEEEGRSLSNAPHRCPSAFAIVDHARTWPKLGSNQELSALITAIHDAGLNVYVDYVANHTGLDHPWMKTDAAMYKKNDEGEPNRAFSGDVSELNYDDDRVREGMLEVGTTLAAMGIDGFRCDMAHLVPADFWKVLISQIKSVHPRFSFIAEAYGQSVFDHRNDEILIHAGFEAIYDGALFTNLRSMATSGSVEYLVSHLNYVLTNHKTTLVHYLCNHDDAYPLPPQTFVPLFGLLSALPGMLLIFNGSDSGFVSRLPHHFVELLPKQLVDGSSMSTELTEWLAIISANGFHLSQFEIADNRVIKGIWNSNSDRGVVYFRLDESPSIIVEGGQ
jgi:hypothetical protein